MMDEASSETCRVFCRNIIKLYIVAYRWTIIDLVRKVVFVHAMKQYRKGKVQLHSLTSAIEVNSQLHVPAVFPKKKQPSVPIE